jgi:hypothetical protein
MESKQDMYLNIIQNMKHQFEKALIPECEFYWGNFYIHLNFL